MEFKKPGFPIIRLNEDYFEVKAIDYWDFRSFRYDEVVKIKFYKESDSSRLWLLQAIFPALNPHILKFYKKNGGDWEYQSSHEEDKEFLAILTEIEKRCKLKIYFNWD